MKYYYIEPIQLPLYTKKLNRFQNMVTDFNEKSVTGFFEKL